MSDPEPAQLGSRGNVSAFSLSNPHDRSGYWDVPRLLRRLADSIEKLGDAEILDITFHNEYNDDFDDMHMTVYYVMPSEEQLAVKRSLGLLE